MKKKMYVAPWASLLNVRVESLLVVSRSDLPPFEEDIDAEAKKNVFADDEEDDNNGDGAEGGYDPWSTWDD